MDRFPQRERQASSALATRVSAIVVVRAARVSGQSPLELCLRGALSEPWIDELVIVDRGCSPAVAKELRALQADRRDVKLVVCDGGWSVADAANLGAENASGRWLLFLDQHVVLRRGAVERMVAAGGGAPAPWVVGGRLSDPMGRERARARTAPLTTWSAFAMALNLNGARARRIGDDAARVSAVSNDFMLLARSDFEALGGFDGRFATHGADLDLCRRAAAGGGAVLLEHGAHGVQFGHGHRSGRKAQDLALFAAKSARTPAERLAAALAAPALSTMLWLIDLVVGRPPLRR